MVKHILLILLFILVPTCLLAQNDPVIMTINGTPVSRSEFEYSFNKNNSSEVIDRKSISEYVDLFVNYKLKVAAAVDAHLDTLTSFLDEFKSYRDQQIRPLYVTDADMEREARKVYDNTVKQIGPDGLLLVRHLMIAIPQKAPVDVQKAAKFRVDSIYKVLCRDTGFVAMVKKYSDDKGSASSGGLLPWISRGRTMPEFESAVFALKVGEMSKPFMTPAGYHIAKVVGRKQLEPYDSLHSQILSFIEKRGMRERVVDEKLDSLVKAYAGKKSKEQILDDKSDEMSSVNPQLRYLIQEYHDGLLLYEISNREVWDKASKDEVGLNRYFKKNKKKYRWSDPRFRGIVYHVKSPEMLGKVKSCIKELPFERWAEVLRTTFNGDSVIRVRADKGLFKRGDNAYVDSIIFKKDTTVQAVRDYPYTAAYGKLLKKGPREMQDVRGLVVADYQDALETEWVEKLRSKYSVIINKEVLSTVNKHN